MTDTALPRSAAAGSTRRPDLSQARLKRRYAAEARFRAYGVAAIALAVGFLVIFLGNIVWKGVPGFFQTYLALDITYDAATLDPKGDGSLESIQQAQRDGAFQKLIADALYARFPEVTERRNRKALRELVSAWAGDRLADDLKADASLLGRTQRVWILASDDAHRFVNGEIPRESPEGERKITDQQIAWIDALAADGGTEIHFEWHFFSAADSREPEAAGFGAAIMGSLYLMLVTLVLCFPVGVMAAIYLEEFAPKNRWTDLIEININNLAAVPSIVFGLLGLAVFLNFFELPRSAPLVGGMVMALLILPTIIIATRAALKAVPPSIRQAALGVGASKLQTVTHHVVPLAMPGILTGTIIGMAHALGETAPLLMIGMFAFIVAAPAGITDPSTAMPVQIYFWADSAEPLYQAKTAAGIILLLVFLILMNAIAIVLRKRFERRW